MDGGRKEEEGIRPLTQRRVSDIIAEFDMLEGERTGIREDVIAAIHQYSKEIEKTWLRDLRMAVLKAVEEVEAGQAGNQ